VLAAIAFCPSPPLLVPALAAGAAAELDPLRTACDRAVGTLRAAGPEEIIVIGTGLRTRWFPPGTTGTLAGYGVPVTARLPGPVPAGTPDGPLRTPAGDAGGLPRMPTGDPDGLPRAPAGAQGDPLPVPLTLGAWLLAGTDVPCSGLAVGPDADPAGPAAALRRDGRVGLLVVADGSARRSEQAPGYVDARAEPFDAAVAAALAAGDAATLRDLDPVLGADLLAAGVPAWRVAGTAADGGRWAADLLHDSAPYGVGYLVATWVPV